MSQQLSAALRETAEQAPSYDVLTGAIALGRRRRRRATLGLAVTLTAIVTLVGVGLVSLIGHSRATSVGRPPAAPSLPYQIGSPSIFASHVTESPSGPASVLFAERSRGLTGDRLVTVGASDDIYRVINTTNADPGRTALLSPQGDRIAYTTGNAITVADLHTGQLRSYPSPEAGADTVSVAAWLPDGRGIVVLTFTYAKDPTIEGTTKRLGIMNVDTGAYKDFAASTWPIAPAGFAVAVSPDGQRIAYQYSDFITIYERGSGAKHKLTLPDTRTALAGKGAWTPDGRSIVVVHRDTDDYQAKRWYLRLLDPQTGVERDPTYRPALSGMTFLRLIGWSAVTGRPIVVGYVADYAIDPDIAYGTALAQPELVKAVGVYEVDATGFRTLLTPAAGVTGLDVADVVIADGLGRPGHPPSTVTPVGWAAIGLAGALIAVLAAYRLRRRYALRRLPQPDAATTPADTEPPTPASPV
jgi:hypothetical protein